MASALFTMEWLQTFGSRLSIVDDSGCAPRIAGRGRREVAIVPVHCHRSLIERKEGHLAQPGFPDPRSGLVNTYTLSLASQPHVGDGTGTIHLVGTTRMA